MATETYDRLKFQDMLLRQIDDKRRYRSEHVGRIARKQSNGNAHMRDSLEGEIAAFDAILGPTDTAQEMVERIDKKIGHAPSRSSVEFPESFAIGWNQGLREALGSLKRYLDEAD